MAKHKYSSTPVPHYLGYVVVFLFGFAILGVIFSAINTNNNQFTTTNQAATMPLGQ
jgi:hypothetical protein